MEHNDHQPIDLFLNDCGTCSCEPGQICSFSPCRDYLLHFISGGNGYLYSNNQCFPFREGQLFLCFPDTADYRIQADKLYPLSYMWISFNGSKAESTVVHTNLSPDHPVCSLLIPAAPVKELIQNLILTDSATLSGEIKKLGYLYRLFALLTASYQASHPKKTTLEYPAKTYAAYAMEYINNNYDRASITDIANQIGIDRSYLHHIFKEFFQVSPQEYLISYRLKTAASLLTETKVSISQVANVVGYDDSLQFSKIFKKHYGCSPKHYRNQVCKERK